MLLHPLDGSAFLLSSAIKARIVGIWSFPAPSLTLDPDCDVTKQASLSSPVGHSCIWLRLLGSFHQKSLGFLLNSKPQPTYQAPQLLLMSLLRHLSWNTEKIVCKDNLNKFLPLMFWVRVSVFDCVIVFRGYDFLQIPCEFITQKLTDRTSRLFGQDCLGHALA
jgi:hypothetical protein